MTALKNRLGARLARLRPHALRKRLRKWLNRSLVQSPIRWGYRRPLLIGPVARLMERRLCIRYGWDLDLFTGKTTVAAYRGGSGAACLRHAYPLLWRQGLKIEALRIAEWTRFGNSVIQLRNALQLAEFLDVKIIEFGQPHPFFAAARVGPYEFVHVDRAPGRVTIEGSSSSWTPFG